MRTTPYTTDKIYIESEVQAQSPTDEIVSHIYSVYWMFVDIEI